MPNWRSLTSNLLLTDLAARSFLVLALRDVVLTDSHRTVLAEGVFPGPLIKGNKVGAISEFARVIV
jgi:hypothetical protein